VLIQYEPMHWLKSADVVHYFNDKINDKRVIPKWVFNLLLACIRHDRRVIPKWVFNLLLKF
jgi:hypothetical protein